MAIHRVFSVKRVSCVPQQDKGGIGRGEALQSKIVDGLRVWSQLPKEGKSSQHSRVIVIWGKIVLGPAVRCRSKLKVSNTQLPDKDDGDGN
ncbi:hypothetical protein RRF57_001118 [Xylaria bambusicola]|uniref:Uncharacterized protein n=1 Tax=Xylaria bambusicola TaxID=326684 RepID=A0AAN7Z1C1_9PEZI